MHWTEYPPGEQLRVAVHRAIEEASGQPLPADDPLPERLIRVCQIAGLPLSTLNVWIFSVTKDRDGWSLDAFVRWAHAVDAVRRLREPRP